MYFFFFFSSRRRHTICSRDWSSDVCSSDLGAEVGGDRGAGDAGDDDRGHERGELADRGEDEEAAEAIEGAEEGEEVGRLKAGGAEAEGDGTDKHRKPAQLQGEDELGDELAAVGVGRADRGRDRLAGEDHHVPHLLEQALCGQEGSIGYGSDHLRLLLSPPHAAPGNGHPDETFTRHQFMSAPMGPHFGWTSHFPHPGSPRSSLLTVSHLWEAGSAAISSSLARARRWPWPRRSATARARSRRSIRSSRICSSSAMFRTWPFGRSRGWVGSPGRRVSPG